MKRIIQGLVFTTAMTMATSALAASALVTTDLNLRTGPGTGYARIAAMPGGSVVDVRGCVRGYSWCRVNWNGYDGWANSAYLARRAGGGSFDSYAASIGVPLIAGAVIGGVIGSSFDHHDYYYYDHGRRYDHRRYDHRRYDHHRSDHGGNHYGGSAGNRWSGRLIPPGHYQGDRYSSGR